MGRLNGRSSAYCIHSSGYRRFRWGDGTRPIKSLDVYREQPSRIMFYSMIVMRPVRCCAQSPKRVMLAEGKKDCFLRSAQTTIDEGLAAFNLLKMPGDNTTIGLILLGMVKLVHILTPTTTVRRIVSIAALASVDAQAKGKVESK